MLRVLEAARVAPSWKNGQCWRFIIVEDREKKESISLGTYNNWVAEAPLLIVVCGNPAESGKREGLDYFMLDVGLAGEQLFLAAINEGLGTCWVAVINERKIKEVLGIPPEIRVVALMPLGYPAEKESMQAGIIKTVLHTLKPKKKLAAIAFRDKWGEPI